MTTPRGTSIECPECGRDDSQVIDSRRANGAIRRRRRCICGVRYTTYESPVYEGAMLPAELINRLLAEIEALQNGLNVIRTTIVRLHNRATDATRPDPVESPSRSGSTGGETAPIQDEGP